MANLLALYLEAREKSGEVLKPTSAMFISLSPNVTGKLENRLTRTSMQRIVNHYLEAARLKHSSNRTITTHGLRHTVGYLLQTAGKPLRVIQEFLGHPDPRTTAIYAHIASLWSDNPITSINIFV